MPDWVVFVGLGLLAFGLMAGWFAVVAKATSTQLPRQRLYFAGAFCAVMTLTFLVISALHLGHRLFGWMTTGSP